MGADDAGVENWMSGRSMRQEGPEIRSRPLAFILDEMDDQSCDQYMVAA